MNSLQKDVEKLLKTAQSVVQRLHSTSQSSNASRSLVKKFFDYFMKLSLKIRLTSFGLGTLVLVFIYESIVRLLRIQHTTGTVLILSFVTFTVFSYVFVLSNTYSSDKKDNLLINLQLFYIEFLLKKIQMLSRIKKLTFEKIINSSQFKMREKDFLWRILTEGVVSYNRIVDLSMHYLSSRVS